MNKDLQIWSKRQLKVATQIQLEKFKDYTDQSKRIKVAQLTVATLRSVDTWRNLSVTMMWHWMHPSAALEWHGWRTRTSSEFGQRLLSVLEETWQWRCSRLALPPSHPHANASPSSFVLCQSLASASPSVFHLLTFCRLWLRACLFPVQFGPETDSSRQRLSHHDWWLVQLHTLVSAPSEIRRRRPQHPSVQCFTP